MSHDCDAGLSGTEPLSFEVNVAAIRARNCARRATQDIQALLYAGPDIPEAEGHAYVNMRFKRFLKEVGDIRLVTPPCFTELIEASNLVQTIPRDTHYRDLAINRYRKHFRGQTRSDALFAYYTLRWEPNNCEHVRKALKALGHEAIYAGTDWLLLLEYLVKSRLPVWICNCRNDLLPVRIRHNNLVHIRHLVKVFPPNLRGSDLEQQMMKRIPPNYLREGVIFETRAEKSPPRSSVVYEVLPGEEV